MPASVDLGSFPKNGVAVVFGASGGIGRALDEASLERAATFAAAKGEIRLVIDATGFLHDDQQEPEKSWRQLDAVKLARSFALNAIGPALIMKHVLPLSPRSGRFVFATLSARVGSIGDNRHGGWYSYRASKAALNQLVRTAARHLLAVIDKLTTDANGGFFDWRGQAVPW